MGRARWCQEYPANWRELALAAKVRAQYRCQKCGVQHGQMAINRHGALYIVRLQAVHVRHDICNPAPELLALCAACHLRYDGFQHWRTRRKNERERQVQAGQMDFASNEAS